MLEKCFLPPPVSGAIRSVSGSCVCTINLCCATGWPWCGSLHVAWRGTRSAWNKLQQPPKLIQSPFSTAHLCGNVHLSTTSQLNWWTRSYPSQCNTSNWQNICYQAYYRVDEEAETTGAGKTSPEIIDVDATTLKTPTATTEACEERESTEDVSGKKGRKFGRQSSDKSTKWCHKSCSTGLAAGALIIVLVYSS